ncbi:MAG: hypothetical protein U1E51_27300 [Candidatus Binatia bacterium]|nr:hypothetical protein [Candidatus Binatia bacterium]
MKWMLHVHHDLVCEILTAPIEERIQLIKAKPTHEIPTRLKVLRELTDEEVMRLPETFRQALAAHAKAWVAHAKSLAAWDPQDRLAWDQAGMAYIQAEAALRQAEVACAGELETWHKSVCLPDCPWNGKTLFPKRLED